MATPLEFIVFSDDWGRWPSSSQHLFRHIAQDHRVLWVETLGMRRPRPSWADLRRGAEKLRSWTGASPESPWVSVPEGLTRFAPPMHPWFGSPLGNRSNDALLVRSVRAKQAELGLRRPVVVITVPVAAGVLGKLGERASLYYRVDDFALWPGYSSAMIRRREELLLRRVSGLLVTAQGLRVPSFGKPQALLDHGVDLTHFGAAPPPPPELTAVRDGRPLLLFAGRIDERIDPTLLRNLPGQVILIGRQSEVRLPPDVTVLPTVPYAQLPAWLSAADVLLLPYTRNRLTDTIQPLKLREYLATGRPIATTDLPEVGRLTAGLAEIGDGPEGFAAACTRALAEDEGRPERRRRLVAEDGWSCRAKELLQFVGRL